MSMLKVLTGFLPWVVFSLVATRAGAGAVTTAAVLAFLVAAAFLVHSKIRGHSLGLLEMTAAVFFAVLAGVGLLYPAADGFLTHYGRALSALTLAAVIFATLPFMPFTEQYARASVPQQYWHSPAFRSTNRRISAAWGAVILSQAVSHALAALLTESTVALGARPVVDLVFNWVVPLGLTWWAAHYTSRVAGAAREHAAHNAAGAR